MQISQIGQSTENSSQWMRECALYGWKSPDVYFSKILTVCDLDGVIAVQVWKCQSTLEFGNTQELLLR